ncbi:MAG: HlyD family efflux transporter periplasmic adaptor subunit [Myxococcota bacterium]|nr:HlyD family efflux transporter periplasmic adaptor subunit [Myxococcota bacterium]
MSLGGEPRVEISSLQLVQRPPALRTLGLVLRILLAVTGVALLVIPWQQNVHGEGRVVAFDPFDRIQTLAAPLTGRVEQAWVIEGSRVEKGDRLLEIVDNDPSILRRLEEQRMALDLQIAAARERVQLFEAQVEALQEARSLAVDSARSQVDVARAAVESAGFGLEAAVAAEQQARLNFERQRELAEEGLASELEAEVAERVYREARARVEQARRSLEAARHDQEAKTAELGRINTQARAGIESARAGGESAEVELAALRERLTALEVKIAQQNTQLIKAPRAGTVYRLYASPGAELVRAGDPLLQLVPDTESRAVEIWVDGNDVPLIEQGRPVRLQFEGWPAVQFSGWPSVAVGTFGGRVALVDPSDDGRGRFRLLVVPDEGDAPWPEAPHLRQGVRARAFVLLDRVSLGYELWRQANGFPPTVAMEGRSRPGSRAGEAT